MRVLQTPSVLSQIPVMCVMTKRCDYLAGRGWNGHRCQRNAIRTLRFRNSVGEVVTENLCQQHMVMVKRDYTVL